MLLLIFWEASDYLVVVNLVFIYCVNVVFASPHQTPCVGSELKLNKKLGNPQFRAFWTTGIRFKNVTLCPLHRHFSH